MQNNMSTITFTVGTFNTLNTPYGFMWGNKCALNSDGEEFIRTSKQFSTDQNYVKNFERKLISSRLSKILLQVV